MRAVRFKVIKIIKEFVILHDCLSFSVFLAGIMCHIIHHFAPLVKRMVSMIAIYIFDARVSYEAINRSRKKHESGLSVICYAKDNNSFLTKRIMIDVFSAIASSGYISLIYPCQYFCLYCSMISSSLSPLFTLTRK